MKTTTKIEKQNDPFFKKVHFLNTVVFKNDRFKKARRFVNDR